MRSNSEFAPTISRRKVLAATGGFGVAGLAGCLGGDDDDDGHDDHEQDDDGDDNGGDGEFQIAAAMPAMWDLSRQVGGDHVEIFDVVPTGEHGHDYTAGASDVETIEEADAFVYLRDFAGWVDDFVAEHEDGNTVEVIDASAGIDFFDSPVEDDDEHWWVDPVECKTGVDNIADGFAELDPDHEDEYEANTEEFKGKLDAIDEEFQDIVDRAEIDQAIVATHNSFGWWVDRYGIDIDSPIGISPDGEASASDIEEMVDIMEDRDVEHILYDLGEPAVLANQLAEETGATVLPLSPIETQIDGSPEVGSVEMSSDWGYVEHFQEINLPSMEEALRAD